MIAYWLYRITYFIVLHLPLGAAYRLAVILSILKYYFSPRDRDAVIANLRLILPEEDMDKVRVYAKEVFVNFGKYLVEFLRFTLFRKRDLGRLIKIEGLEHIDSALKKGKGVIVLSAHMGNWELGGVAMASMGYPILAVALPHRHRKVNEFFNYQRERLGMAVVPSVGVAVRRIYEALSKNKIIALVGDRDFANGGNKMPFLGVSKGIPRGPAVLSKRTGATIVPGFVIRQKDDSSVLTFYPALDPKESEEEMISDYVKVIEEMIRRYPSQWLMFREFWKE